MKNLFKKLPVVLILLLAVLFNGCEKDLYEEPLKKQKKPNITVQSKKVTNKSLVFQKLKKSFPTKLTLPDNARTSELLPTLQVNFGEIKLENVLEVAEEHQMAYSFEIKEAVKKPNEYMNLVIDKENVVWLYKIEKLLQQENHLPAGAERLVRFKLNSDLTLQNSRPCDSIIYPPFEPDLIDNPNSGPNVTFPGSSNWQNNPPNGGFFGPTVITIPGSGSSGSGSSGSGSSSSGSTSGSPGSGGSGGNSGAVEVIVAVGSAIGNTISDGWHWLVELFSGTPKPQASGCNCNRNAIVIALPDNPCGPAGYIAIYPQSELIDKINELDITLYDQLTYYDKMYLHNEGNQYLDYFYNLAQNPPVGFNPIDVLPPLIKHLRTTGDFEFVQLLINYLINNINVTWQEISDSFLSPYPEIDNLSTDINPEDITYDNPLTIQSLPTLTSFLNNFPKNGSSGNYSQMPASDVYNLVGGTLLNSYNSDPNTYANACSIRGSRALLYSNIQIPILRYNGLQRTQKGGDLKNYILDAVSFNKFMIDKFGETVNKLEGTDANNPQQILNFLSGKNGVYVIINNEPSQAGYSGHVDLIINGNCIGNEYLRPRGGVKSIKIWVLN